MTTSSTTATPPKRQSTQSATPYTNELQPSVDLIEYAKTYARQKPQVAALWCFGIGFVLGWKLKPW